MQKQKKQVVADESDESSDMETPSPERVDGDDDDNEDEDKSSEKSRVGLNVAEFKRKAAAPRRTLVSADFTGFSHEMFDPRDRKPKLLNQ